VQAGIPRPRQDGVDPAPDWYIRRVLGNEPLRCRIVGAPCLVGERGRCGVDVAIEALGTQGTFESSLKALRPGGTLSSLGVYSSDLKIPLGAFSAGLGDLKIVSTLCPGGKERMRRLMDVVGSGRVDLAPLVTHRFKLDDIEAAYELFANQRDGVLKVAITP